MRVLGIDTSTFTASVAVVAGDRVLAARDSAVSTHSENLLDTIEATLTAAAVTLAAVDAVAIGAGPGSFTGLRIGMATAKGLAFGASKPLWVTSSLAALAFETAPGDRVIVPVLDARRGELYAGFYVADAGAGLRAVGPERVIAPGDLAAHLEDVAAGRGATIVGDAIARYDLAANAALAAVAAVETGARPTPSGIAVARLAARGDRADALSTGAPVYIRLAEAEIKFPDGNPGGTFSA